jgi:hypothetical protein
LLGRRRAAVRLATYAGVFIPVQRIAGRGGGVLQGQVVVASGQIRAAEAAGFLANVKAEVVGEAVRLSQSDGDVEQIVREVARAANGYFDAGCGISGLYPSPEIKIGDRGTGSMKRVANREAEVNDPGIDLPFTGPLS